MRIIRCRVEFVPRDLWVGLFWDRRDQWRRHPRGQVQRRKTVHAYLCLVPCCPLHLAWETSEWVDVTTGTLTASCAPSECRVEPPPGKSPSW